MMLIKLKKMKKFFSHKKNNLQIKSNEVNLTKKNLIIINKKN